MTTVASSGSGREAEAPLPTEQSSGSAHRHNRALLAVGVFKLAKTVFFGTIGIGALRLLHRNVGDLVMRVTDALPLDPEGHFVSLVMDRADLIGNHQLRLVSAAALTYAVLCLIEGIGLLLEKVWAEYFTLVLTTLALPWEFYELTREPSALKAALTAANIVVVLYLLWHVRRLRRQHAAA